MREFKTLFDVYMWATRTGSVVDTNPQIFHPCGLFEDEMEQLEKIFEQALNDIPIWATHYYAKRVDSLSGDEVILLEEIKKSSPWIDAKHGMPISLIDLSERYLAWNGKRIAIINHGYDFTWVDSSGIAFDFTHWMPLPKGPK